MKKILSLFLILYILTGILCISVPAGGVYILDAGHGSPDGGSVGYAESIEKDINLLITKKLGLFFRFFGMEYVYTRSDDRAIYDRDAETIREKKVSDLSNRLAIARETKNAAFLSIHMNASTSSGANGIQFFYGKAFQSAEMAACLTAYFLSQPIGQSVRNSEKAPETVFLAKNITCPYLILEYGFLTNPEEEKLLNQDEHQNLLAAATTFGLLNYINQRG